MTKQLIIAIALAGLFASAAPLKADPTPWWCDWYVIREARQIFGDDLSECRYVPPEPIDSEDSDKGGGGGRDAERNTTQDPKEQDDRTDDGAERNND